MSFLINRKEFVQMPLLFISFTGVSSYGNFRLSFGHAACPLGARCLPQVRKLLTPHGHAACPIPVVFVNPANDYGLAIFKARNNSQRSVSLV